MPQDPRSSRDRRSRGGGRDASGGGKAGGGKAGGGKAGGRGRPSPRADETDRVSELAGPLARVLKRLPEIERRVVEYRMGLVDGHTHNLAETARHLNLTQHEAKTIEQRAFERIREVVPLGQLQKFLQG